MTSPLALPIAAGPRLDLALPARVARTLAPALRRWPRPRSMKLPCPGESARSPCKPPGPGQGAHAVATTAGSGCRRDRLGSGGRRRRAAYRQAGNTTKRAVAQLRSDERAGGHLSRRPSRSCAPTPAFEAGAAGRRCACAFGQAGTDDEIERYLRLEQPYDCAGSAKCETLGIALLAAIESDDPTALVGLPLIATCDLLRAAGIDPLADPHR